uniref:Uncharacterized protein n=1 Tax=Sinocyclocheilus anshuiensis TaxID=1608454 RepID=A0A671LJ19_9TELE
ENENCCLLPKIRLFFFISVKGGSLLASPFLKGFLAGYVLSRLRSSVILGAALGTLTGIYAAQNYEVPNIETSLRDFLNSLKKGPSD